jgi:hypothetical protein
MSWKEVVGSQLGEPGVTEAKMFGSECLKVGAKVFAVDYKGALVLKLPRERVEQEIAAGEGSPFTPMAGRVMKEWVQIAPSPRWPELAAEARQFVSG